MNTQRIMIVDDDPATRKMLSELLRIKGYEVRDAEGGREALGMMPEWRPDLMLLDLIMPGMDGYAVAHQLRQDAGLSRMAIVMITGRDVSKEKTKAIEAGADDLLCKPICVAELLARVKVALAAKAYRDRLESQRAELEAEVSRQTAALREALEEVSTMAQEIVHRLARAAEFRDDSTGAHVERVGRYAEVIALAMGCSPEECRMLRLAATMHDVGKIGVPDDVLRKPGTLTPQERKIMEQHTYIGEQILHGSAVDLVRTAAMIALNHHEWWNGEGYPQRLRGAAIPRYARIVGVVDALDAMTSLRPYRKAMSMDEALGEITAKSGIQFDPDVVSAVLRVRAQIEDIQATYPLQG